MPKMIDDLNDTYELVLDNFYEKPQEFLGWLENYIYEKTEKMNVYVGTFCEQVLEFVEEFELTTFENEAQKQLKQEKGNQLIGFLHSIAKDATHEYIETGTNTFYTQDPNSIWNWF